MDVVPEPHTGWTFLTNHARVLATIADNPKKRRAWQLLVGPVNWKKAVRLDPQDGEPDVEAPG